jgi:hypothetical protein
MFSLSHPLLFVTCFCGGGVSTGFSCRLFWGCSCHTDQQWAEKEVTCLRRNSNAESLRGTGLIMIIWVPAATKHLWTVCHWAGEHWRCRCSSCRFEFPLSMPPKYGHVLRMQLVAVEYSQFLSSNWGSLELVVFYQYLLTLIYWREGTSVPNEDEADCFEATGSRRDSRFLLWQYEPQCDEIRYLLERERETTHTHTEKVGNSRNSFQCPNHWSLHNECTHLLPVCKPSWHSYSVHWIIFEH